MGCLPLLAISSTCPHRKWHYRYSCRCYSHHEPCSESAVSEYNQRCRLPERSVCSNLGRKLKPRLAKRTCILMLSGRSGSARRSTACIRKRMLPVPKRKYRNVRDQRWGKCIFLNPVPADVRSIHSQGRMQKNGIYSSSRVNTVFYFLRIIVCKKLCYQFHTTFHIFFICYLCRHVHITKRD